ncbi:ABC transporter permease subunit, partial [bacterium]|nr:ABC transporter permease subunit [bacterium]
MTSYFIRRFLLIIPTFLGITFLCFTITRFVPGGPVEQAILRYQEAAAQGEGGALSNNLSDGKNRISEEMMNRLKEIYGFDKPFYIAYFIWLGKVFRFDLGMSDTYSRPVWDIIRERFPVSLWFGIAGFLLSYTLCIPLGVWKAVKHGSKFDTFSSIFVFVGYAIPGWAAGVLLLLLFGGGSFWSLFPLGGAASTSVKSDSFLSGFLLKAGKAEDLPLEVKRQFPELRENSMVFENHQAFKHFSAEKIIQPSEGEYQNLSWFGKILDRIWHMFLPVLCYMLGQFASLSVLMKNSLMENLGQDYVRTAFAKGLPEKTVIFKHALRNSLIPIATGMGHIISMILAGSYLIEKVFNIHGFGLLGYTSLVARDYP